MKICFGVNEPFIYELSNNLLYSIIILLVATGMHFPKKTDRKKLYTNYDDHYTEDQKCHVFLKWFT